MAFSKVSNTEVTGTGTIADLISTIANTSYAEQVGIRTCHLKSEMIVSGTGSELTIPYGWHVDVDTRLRAEDNAKIIVGSEDTYSPKEGASIWFDNPTPASDWSYGSMDADDTATWEVYNSTISWNTGSTSNRPLTCGYTETGVTHIFKNSVFYNPGTTGSLYLSNATIEDCTIVGGIGGEFINSPTSILNTIITEMGSQGLKIYTSDTTVRGVSSLADSTYVFSVDNGRTYTIIDSSFDDDQVVFLSDGSNLDDNTILEQYSVNGVYSIGGIAQTGIDYILLDNANAEIDSGTVSGAGAITEVIDSVYRHNEGDHGTNFDDRDGDWFIPWIYRARKYDLVWTELELAPSEPVDVSTGLPTDTFVTQASGTASAHTGISITDHGSSPASWQSKSWGITVTGNLTTNPSLNIEDIKHYLKYHLSDDSSFNGKSSALMWHDLIPMSGLNSLRGWVFGPRLTATLAASATTASISSNAGLPSSGTVKIEDEEIAYTGTTSTTLTGLSRGQNGTSDVTHTFADANPIYFRLAKGVRVVDESANTFPGVKQHQSDDGSYYIAPVPIKVTVKDINTLGLIQGARVFVETAAGGPASPGVEIINELTDIDGEVNDTYDYVGDQPISGRVRKATP